MSRRAASIRARFEPNDYRLAAAALLVHAAAIDGSMSPTSSATSCTPSSSGGSVSTTRRPTSWSREATEAEHEAVDLYHFTSLINRSLDEDGRRRMVEMMWEMVYADGRVSEFEDNLIWRAADLLGISSRDRIELRRRVAADRGDRRGLTWSRSR